MLAANCGANSQAEPGTGLKLWYDSPANQWIKALPIGNGRLGAMVFGGVEKERLQFNDDTLWTGQPHEYQNPGAVKYLPDIRRLIDEGKQGEAETLAQEHFMSIPIGQQAYQPFGDLLLSFPMPSAAMDYRRELDLDTAVTSVSYRLGDVRYERQAFSSNPDQVLVWQINASQPGSVSFKATLSSQHSVTTSVKGDQLAFSGQIERGGLRFEARIRVVASGGSVTVTAAGVTVEHADSALLILAGATSFVTYQDISADPAARCEKVMAAVASKDFETLRATHIADYQRLFRRVALDLGSGANAQLPTDQRLVKNQETPDPDLAALLFQYGRYLLIASSRPGSQPANLQGIWNDSRNPPWECKWTTNINLEMNYWPAETTGLAECHEPLFDLIDDLVASGGKTAQAHYGARGWVLHHNTDLWRGTAPINYSNHGIWVSGGAWLCHHLWDHYRFTGDRDFLARRGYPAMKGAALFFVDFLVKDPKTGWLISTPSNSPEQGGLVAGPAMDHQLIRDLFANTAAAAKVLGVDHDFAAQLDEMRPRIAPDQVGKHGQLREWSLADNDDPANQHRHVSHLWAVHPGWDITPATPKLFAAAKQSLVFRGDDGTGWAIAWKTNLWARLRDGDHALKLLQTQLRPVIDEGVNYDGGGGTYPNLFDAHPPFQIDGNFGATSGIVEMLLQSHTGEIQLLPALPMAWPNGSVKGLRSRGGFTVDIAWQGGKVTSYRIASPDSREVTIRVNGETKTIQSDAGSASGRNAPVSLPAAFANPPPQYRARPLYWLNGNLDPETLREQIQAMRDTCGFGGFAPLVLQSAKPEYLTEEYFERYKLILETAEKLGLKVIFYDDISFPTGTAGGRLAERFPESVIKNLRKEEREVRGPVKIEVPVPHGTLMAAVAMENTTKQRINLASHIRDGTLRWDAPAGPWKVMFFMCEPEGQFVDYLDPEAVKDWMSITYDEFARRFGRHFGTTITQSFFDDPAMVYTSGGRTWTTGFNTKFQQKNGTNPALLYPAMWYDIGPETASARVALFGFRAELFGEGFVRTVHEWCARHGIQVSGHPAGNYEPQPVEVSGDNIKFYEHCDIPLLDSIHYYGHGRDGFKLVTSASSTYDRPVTAVEIYGNYPDHSVDAAMLYRSAMELYVRGANLMIPHGMWYEPATMHIPPEFSHRNPRFGAELPAYNNFVGRCSMVLQGGRHAADIGVLYPVVALQAAYRFDVPGLQQPNWGKDAPPEADYLKISNRLTGSVRRDFTFLHPEAVDERCKVVGPTLRLDNPVNHEDYRVIVIPGGKVISWSNLRKIRQFHENGGHVVATTQLPYQSSESGHDEDVRRTVKEMFGIEPVATVRDSVDESRKPFNTRANARGGKAYYAPNPTTGTLHAILDDALPVADVSFEGAPHIDSGGGMLSYLHKVKDGTHWYYFANSSNDKVEAWVRLRGKLALQSWDPHSGTMVPLECGHLTENGQDVTRVHLVLDPVKSVFLRTIAEDAASAALGKKAE